MISVTNIILSVLAVYRISRLIVGEMGPFNIFYKLRGYIMSKYDNDHWLYSGINCPLCVSFWISMIPAFYTADTAILWVIHWLGIAGAVTIIYRRIE